MGRSVNNLKKKAISISNKFPFSEFKVSAESVKDDSIASISTCKNHLDSEFMKLLENGAHLDIARLPL